MVHLYMLSADARNARAISSQVIIVVRQTTLRSVSKYTYTSGVYRLSAPGWVPPGPPKFQSSGYSWVTDLEYGHVTFTFPPHRGGQSLPTGGTRRSTALQAL